MALSDEKPRIVIIDDDPSVVATLEMALGEDYDVVAAGDAATGVSLVDDGIAAVVLDVKMEGHDGFWACEQIQSRCPFVPVIFHSAYQDAKNPFEIINAHRPFAYIAKGDSFEKLQQALARAVDFSDRLWAHDAFLRLQGSAEVAVVETPRVS
jgi:DNA-binding NtrC family response regulator